MNIYAKVHPKEGFVVIDEDVCSYEGEKKKRAYTNGSVVPSSHQRLAGDYLI